MKISSSPSRLQTSAALAVLLALGATTGCHHDPNVQKRKYLESGKRYAAEGKYKEATIQFSNALKVDHNFADAHYQLASAYLKMGSPLPAYAELSRTVALQPDNVQARIDLGNILLAGKQADRASEQANAVLALNSNNADAYALLASIAASKGNRPEALAQIQHALAIDPNRSAFHTALGLIQSSDPAASGSAEQQLRQAVSLDPKNLTAHLVLASMLERKGDLAAALEEQKAGVAADPKNLMARASLAELYNRQGDKAKTEDVLRQATEDLSDTIQGAQLLESYYLHTGQLDRGISVYADLVSKHSKNVPLKIAYARLLFANKDFPKAKSVAADLEKTNSTDPDVAVLNSLIQMNDGKPNDAFDTLQKAEKNNPENLQVKLLLGRAALSKGDLNIAQQTFTDASRMNATSMEAAEGLAQVALTRRDVNLLAHAAELAIANHPQSPFGYLWRGMAEGSQQQTDRAEADFRQVLKIDPKNWQADMELGQLKLSEKKPAEARALLEQALAINPASARTVAILVSMDLADKQPQKALARVEAQAAKVPNNADLQTELSILQMQAGSTDAAVASASKAMQLNPSDAGAVMAYSRAEIAHGDPGKAVDSWQNWLKSHPGDAQANAILGTLEQARGDKDAAQNYYKAALKIQPDQPIAANNLAYLMIDSNSNLDVALSLAQTAHRSMPNNPSTADTLAWAYYAKGVYGSARDLLEDAVKAAPEDASIQYHLGMTYSKLADNSDAIIHLKKAATLAPESPSGKDAQKALQSIS